MMFSGNIRYRHDRELYSTWLLCCPFSPLKVVPFLPNCLHCILFQLFMLHFSFQPFTPHVSAQLSFQTKLPCFPICTGRQKESHSFYSRGFQSITFHYSCWLLVCGTSQVRHNIYIYIYIYLCWKDRFVENLTLW